MQLVHSPASPFVRKVRACLIETGQQEDVTLKDVATTALDVAEDARAGNPSGKIPSLIRPDGPALYDSRVITRYLADRAVKAGGVDLYPESRIWEVLTLEATADAIMESAVLVVYESRLRPPEHRSEDWIEAQWSKVAHSVKAVNDRWMSHLAGPLDMSHIAIGCALGYLDFRHEARGWRKGNDALDDWFAVFSTRPCMAETAP
ncbi:glutathione S-transferase family protein [Rhodalgimonas zhirmunskyi]|uniref:Glutathione S-transferase family protein n=1 Tax=Rhodalgimonas zhirmunskyi TaxID=2964767 RepID=A0AAJ1X4A1_9RHOB|nr:glutathione S-transferase family protein [Rhodoalgimonas zhirmunskyi]MDQ2094073.1 glutathione S-transferase family protein [Rhodoalgimonas zhirmunskyi]